MKLIKLLVALIAAAGFSMMAGQVMAYEAGDWLVRVRVITVAPNHDSGQLYINGVGSGPGVRVNDDTVPELDITYMITRNWALELILAYSEHTVKGEKTWAALGDVIDTKVLPPTLTLQYHFAPDSNIRPYLGVGVNYTHFFDEEVAGSVLPAPGDKVELDDSWGLAAQAGIDIKLDDDWFINLDVKYVNIETEAHFKNIAVGSATINAEINPIIWGVGIGRRF